MLTFNLDDLHIYVHVHCYPYRTGIQTFRRENDRFWVIAAHPTQNLFAAGTHIAITLCTMLIIQFLKVYHM